MNSYTTAEKNSSFEVEMMGQERQKKALREFKEVLQDLVRMLREASETETCYLYWINRARRQFVMETQSTSISEVVFQDRLQFDEHFLDAYKDIDQPITLEVGRDIEADIITHYYSDIPVQYITLLPFVNNEETVAITVVESVDSAINLNHNEGVYSYLNALGKVLNTYLELSDLYEQENEWIDYEESLQFLNQKGHHAGLLATMLNTMQKLLDHGGVSLIAKGMGSWVNILNSDHAREPISIGLPVEHRSVANDALKSGEPEFAIHFNKNPKRVSPRELYTEGATLAIPILFNGYRKGLVMVYEENPLVFKESTKHKLVNIARLTGLQIQARLKTKAVDDTLLSNDCDAFIPDLWERAINMQIERLENEQAEYHTWVGMITLSKLSQIRTQLRLEELDLMQKDLVRAFNPNQYGISGLIGFHADYIYTVVLQGKDPQAITDWAGQVKQKFRSPLKLTNGKEISTGVNIGYVELDAESGDSYTVISKVKRALSNRTSQ